MSIGRGDTDAGVTRAIENGPGTYVLLFTCPASVRCDVGRLGRVTLEPGHYLYVGSAFGPGGVRARVARHLRRDKSRHWHLDYVREALVPLEVWFTLDAARHEHELAAALAASAGLHGVRGFGSSDCGCASHLFAGRRRPRPSRLQRATGVTLRVWRCGVEEEAASPRDVRRARDG